MRDTGYSYIGRMSCGCVVAAVVEDPDRPSRHADAIREFVMDGLTIERVTHDYVRQHLGRCKHRGIQQSLLLPADAS